MFSLDRELGQGKKNDSKGEVVSFSITFEMAAAINVPVSFR